MLCEADGNYASSAQNNAKTQKHFIELLGAFMTTQDLPRASKLRPRWRGWREVVRGQWRENRG